MRNASGAVLRIILRYSTELNALMPANIDEGRGARLASARKILAILRWPALRGLKSPVGIDRPQHEAASGTQDHCDAVEAIHRLPSKTWWATA